MSEMKTLRQMLVSDEKWLSFCTEFAGIPKRILDTQDAMDAAQRDVSEFYQDAALQEQLDNMEAEAYFLIRDEKGDDGKAKYTNEEQRKAAAKLSLRDDEEYRKIKEELWAIKSKKSDLKMRVGKLSNMIKYLYNTQRVMETVGHMIGGLSHEAAAEIEYSLVASCLKPDIEEVTDTEEVSDE